MLDTLRSNFAELDITPMVKLKSIVALAAFVSFLLSVALFFSGDYLRGIFVGIWVPSILSAGCFLLVGGKS